MLDRIFALLAIFVLAGCSGSGGPSAAPASTSQPATSNAARGTLGVTIHYSALHQQAASAVARLPKFVDGAPGTYLTTYAYDNVTGNHASSTANIPVAPDANGNQVIAIPAYATTNGYVAISEFDSTTNGAFLAGGSTNYTLGSGVTSSIAITMDIVPNGIYVALLASPTAPLYTFAQSVTTSGSIYNVPNGSTSATNPAPNVTGLTCIGSPFFIGTTDALGGFANPNGTLSGSFPTVSLISQETVTRGTTTPVPPGGTLAHLEPTPISGGFKFISDPNFDSVIATFTTSNAQNEYTITLAIGCNV